MAKTKAAKPKPAKKDPAPKKEKKEKVKVIPISSNGNGEEKLLVEKPEKPVKAKDKVKIPKVTTKVTTISKVKIDKKGQVAIFYTKIESDGSTTTCPETHRDRVAHPDLIAKFAALRVHLGLLLEYVSTQQVKDIDSYNPDIVEKFEVRGVTIGGGDKEGYLLTGLKTLKNGKKVAINTPFTLLEEAEETAYRYIDDLGAKVDELIAEVKLYQTGEKVGTAQQPELPFEDEEDEPDNPFKHGEEN